MYYAAAFKYWTARECKHLMTAQFVYDIMRNGNTHSLYTHCAACVVPMCTTHRHTLTRTPYRPALACPRSRCLELTIMRELHTVRLHTHIRYSPSFALHAQLCSLHGGLVHSLRDAFRPGQQGKLASHVKLQYPLHRVSKVGSTLTLFGVLWKQTRG